MTAFLLRWLRDEAADRFGFFPGKAKRACRFVDARTVALGCDCNGGDAYVMWGQRHLWREEAYRNIGTARTVWLRLDSIADFAERILPQLPHPIVLVTQESDYSPLLWQPRAAEALLTSDKIAHWFCAQCDIPGHDEKLTRVPLGIHYRFRDDLTVPSNPFHFEDYEPRPCNIDAFEQRIDAILATAQQPQDRPLKLLADFAINNTSGDNRFGETRADIAHILAPLPFVEIPPHVLRQIALYHRYAQAAFVASPHGKGLDCYRTWEALVMGAIPIVKRSALDPVYEGFPVVILEDWREVTAANLARWRGEKLGGFTPEMRNRLTSRYWSDRIKRVAAAL